MNKKECIVFIAKNYGIMPMTQIKAATNMSSGAIANYAWRLRRNGVAVARYSSEMQPSAYKEALTELLASK